jgi:NAD-dependent dihydropyrimidine dehydrogenase PreA subunit
MATPRIDSKRCNVCGTCKEICPMGVFSMNGDSISVEKPQECIDCRACEAHCNKGAVKVDS